MKKLVSIPYLTLITLSLLTLLYFGNDSKTDDVLYNEVSEISIVTKNDGNVYSSEVFFNQINKIFKKYNVSFYKYSYINEKKLKLLITNILIMSMNIFQMMILLIKIK